MRLGKRYASMEIFREAAVFYEIEVVGSWFSRSADILGMILRRKVERMILEFQEFQFVCLCR